MKIICEYCSKDFNRSPAQISKHNFCSRICYIKAKKENKTLHPSYNGGDNVVCTHCGELTYKNPSQLVNRSNYFCSVKCFGEWTSINKVGKNSLAYKGALLEKNCLICNETFTTYSKMKKYCSIGCGNKAKEKKIWLTCDSCSTKFERQASALYYANKRGQIHNFCSKKCSNEYHRGSNSSLWITDRFKLKDKHKSIRWSKQMIDWRKKVYKRDNYTCQLCNNRSSKNNGLILNAHHIVRFIDNEYLRFDVDNGITLCKDCHRLTYGKEYKFEEQFKNKIKEYTDE